MNTVSISNQPVSILPGRIPTQNHIVATHAPSGIFLKEAQTQWMSRPQDQRFETLDALQAAVEGRRAKSRSHSTKLADILITAGSENGLQVQSRITSHEVAPSHWAFGQLCQRIGAPAGYMRTLPSELAASNLNYSLKSADKEGLKFLTVEGDESNTLQAVTSQTYGRIWDADVVQAVRRIMDRSGGKFFNPKDWSGKPSGLYASDHDMFAFMIDGGSIIDGGSVRDQLHRGFFISNSETGAKSLWLKTFLFRMACGNHLVWHAEDINEFTLRHSQGAPARFDNEAYPKLVEFINASAKPIEDNVRKAKAYMLPYTESRKGSEGLIDFGTKYGFSRPEIRGAFACAIEEEGQCGTLWDFVNGLTAHARGYEFVDARVDLESRAGKLLALAV